MKEIKTLLKLYSREELAVKFEVSVRTIERWRDGDSMPRRRDMREIGKLLGRKGITK